MPPSINLIAFFEQVAISCFFFRLFVRYIFKKTKRYKAKEKKRNYCEKIFDQLGTFYSYCATLFQVRRDQKLEICVSVHGFNQLVDQQLIGSRLEMSSILLSNSVSLYLRQKCHVNFRDRFEGLHANQIGFSKPPRKFTSSVLPFIGKIMVVLFSSLFTC